MTSKKVECSFNWKFHSKPGLYQFNCRNYTIVVKHHVVEPSCCWAKVLTHELWFFIVTHQCFMKLCMYWIAINDFQLGLQLQCALRVFIVLSCLISVSVNFSACLVTGKTSPITYQVLGYFMIRLARGTF